MAELVELPQEFDTVDESGFNPHIPDNFLYEWLINYVLNFEETGSISEERDSRVMQEKVTLFEIASDLTNIFINLLKQKIKLLDIQKKVLIAKLTISEDILKIYEDFLKNEDLHEKSDSQEYLGIVNSTMKKFQNKRKEILSEDTDKIVEEIYEKFLKYQEVYKKYEGSLKEILNYSEKKLKISNVPRNCQEDFCILISVLEESLTSCNLTLASSKEAFHVFESLLTNDLIVSGQKLKKRINLFMTAFEKVEFTYSEAFSIFSEVLNLDCATRALY